LVSRLGGCWGMDGVLVPLAAPSLEPNATIQPHNLHPHIPTPPIVGKQQPQPNPTQPKVPNDDDATAAAMVNACNYGLGSSVFSANQVGALCVELEEGRERDCAFVLPAWQSIRSRLSPLLPTHTLLPTPTHHRTPTPTNQQTNRPNPKPPRQPYHPPRPAPSSSATKSARA
jgi:hypothetical protein